MINYTLNGTYHPFDPWFHQQKQVINSSYQQKLAVPFLFLAFIVLSEATKEWHSHKSYLQPLDLRIIIPATDNFQVPQLHTNYPSEDKYILNWNKR